MKKAPRLTPLILLPLFAIVGSTGGVQHAHAATISAFTGSFSVDGDDQDASRDLQSFSNLFVLFGSNLGGFFSTDPSIGNYSHDHGCDNNVFPCGENWSGTFNGGSVSLIVGGVNEAEFFAGTITGGSFSGDLGCVAVADCFGTNDQTLSFTAIWANGWRSEGTLSMGNNLGDFSLASGGTLSMTTVTTTPEPGSMTLLGSGILAAAGFLRRRLRNRSRCCQRAQTRRGF